MKSNDRVLLCCFLVAVTEASFRVPDLPVTNYTVHGDINLGGIFRIHEYSGQDLCGDEVHGQKLFQYTEAMVHAIHYANSLPHVLPNISLGFTILDTCTKDQVRTFARCSKTFNSNIQNITFIIIRLTSMRCDTFT